MSGLIVDSTPQAYDFNKYFSILAEALKVTLPYVFVDGTYYSQRQVNENFETIVEALRKRGCL